jgi:hypothetical protein
MKKINEFNKGNLKEFRHELDAVLTKFGVKVGLDIRSEKINYNDSTATITIDAKLHGSQSREAMELELYSDFKENDIIRIKQLGEVRFVGYKTKNRKYPFIVETVHTGNRYKLSQQHVNARVNIV